jgi:hypothetical protein
MVVRVFRADDPEAIPLLRSMELDREALIEVVRTADQERSFCTSNDVQGFDLITVNAKAARALRDIFCGERWQKDETENQPGIRNPHLGLRVIPLSIHQFNRHSQSFGSGRHSRRSLMARRRPRVNQESLPRASLAG